jgi:hypothetical protein
VVLGGRVRLKGFGKKRGFWDERVLEKERWSVGIERDIEIIEGSFGFGSSSKEGGMLYREWSCGGEEEQTLVAFEC